MAARFHVVIPLYPGVTQLDFTGPFEVLQRLPGAHCTLASVAGADLRTDGGLTFTGLERLAEVEHADLLCVPGGHGTITAINDLEYLTHLRRLGAQARYLTSVCTGSLLLAAAGLLRGRRAGCHWAWRDLLAAFDVEPDPARVVEDGPCLTGGGVTAGIDLALTVVARIAGEDYAQAVQLALEYAPEPPFAGGRPDLAPPPIRAMVESQFARRAAERAEAVRRAARRAWPDAGLPSPGASANTSAAPPI